MADAPIAVPGTHTDAFITTYAGFGALVFGG